MQRTQRTQRTHVPHVAFVTYVTTAWRDLANARRRRVLPWGGAHVREEQFEVAQPNRATRHAEGVAGARAVIDGGQARARAVTTAGEPYRRGHYRHVVDDRRPRRSHAPTDGRPLIHAVERQRELDGTDTRQARERWQPVGDVHQLVGDSPGRHAGEGRVGAAHEAHAAHATLPV